MSKIVYKFGRNNFKNYSGKRRIKIRGYKNILCPYELTNLMVLQSKYTVQKEYNDKSRHLLYVNNIYSEILNLTYTGYSSICNVIQLKTLIV